MSRKEPERDVKMREARKIIDCLEEVVRLSAYRRHEVFRDFLDIAEATLKEEPALARACLLDQEHVDAPETQAVWKRIRERYARSLTNYDRQNAPVDFLRFDPTGKTDGGWKSFQFFGQAFEWLMKTRTQYWDNIGEVFMAYGAPQAWHGQFFTPMDVAKLCVRLTMDFAELEQEAHRRILEGARQSPWGEAIILSSALLKGPAAARDHFFNQVIPAALPYVQPLRIYDPTCGSGVFLLAAARDLPDWMNYFGLVQYYGQDIDIACVKMARINLMLYGLNGHALRCALGVTDADAADITPALREEFARGQKIAAAIAARAPLDGEAPVLIPDPPAVSETTNLRQAAANIPQQEALIKLEDMPAAPETGKKSRAKKAPPPVRNGQLELF